MIYTDKKLYAELLQILKSCMNEIHCPVCGNDLRPKYHCEGCEIDHTGSECHRDGKHKENCLL